MFYSILTIFSCCQFISPSLYTDYVKVDDEDALFFKYLEHSYERQQQIQPFNKVQEQMQRYIKENSQL
ncbi:hypothetical protein C9E89_018425 [Acinetobacter sichuanensis]|uniref:Uncharacterized protein n=1 Tax=Acinetobacter sichuanensis TaxID=2136183 RepID=A0A371YKU5_9GAMM|nr:hypothetical protein C9E89_018425 [Acinetobacter sichuanensis]